MIVSQSYGVRRPLEIAAKLAALRTQFTPAILPAPVFFLVPAAPLETRAQYAARMASYQAERAAIRADLPAMRHYAARHDDGPTVDEIAALESRLADLNDYLIFEIDPADLRTNELPLAA